MTWVDSSFSCEAGGSLHSTLFNYLHMLETLCTDRELPTECRKSLGTTLLSKCKFCCDANLCRPGTVGNYTEASLHCTLSLREILVTQVSLANDGLYMDCQSEWGGYFRSSVL